ncbi:unnamed protein product [Symbiodinium necroappetens]|uniref:BTB domain-containing protein n=1 Tax=Symbiodinium necroappetens TaxID=1628268 RepID=A0A812UKD7_9DINO|nr:unnamed protein product [Symbiodinium necroappetens]
MPPGPARRGLLTFVVGGEPFEIPWPYLALHSPVWADKLAEDPNLAVIELEGEADSFRAYLNFLQGADGPTGDLSPSNFLQILHWNQEFGVEHIRGQCEAFLLDPRCREAIELSPDEVLEIAARHDMPKLYEKAVEVTGQGMQYIQVPKGEPTKFDSEDLRTDVVKAHLSMGVMCADGEMRCRHRYADQALLPDAHERARLLWKSRGRFRKPAPAEPDHDWRCPQMVWPHHSFRGEDWTAIASETQPTLPRRSALRPGCPVQIGAVQGCSVDLSWEAESSMVKRRWQLGLGGLGLGQVAMAKPRKRYARSMVANADDLLRWFPKASLVVLRGAAVQIGIEELGMAEALLNGSELFPQDSLHYGFGIYNPSLAHAKPGYLLAVFRASNWHYCPESGWDGNWTSVPHHKAQATQYNQPILATLKLPDLTVVEAVPVAFQRDRFRARFQEVQDGKVLAERSIEGPEDLRLYKFEEDYWLSFSFRTSYIAKLQTRLCFGNRAHGCTPAAWIETGTLMEITPEALHRREHREQQAFKNLNLAQVRKESILVEFSLNPRIMLEVDLASGLWQQVSSTQTPALPLLPTSQFFYRGGFCCVGPVDWGGLEVSIGIAHIKFNRYVFLHRFYLVNNESPYEVLATSPELCFHYLGQEGLAWDELGHGCETVQFASGPRTAGRHGAPEAPFTGPDHPAQCRCQ